MLLSTTVSMFLFTELPVFTRLNFIYVSLSLSLSLHKRNYLEKKLVSSKLKKPVFEQFLRSLTTFTVTRSAGRGTHKTKFTISCIEGFRILKFKSRVFRGAGLQILKQSVILCVLSKRLKMCYGYRRQYWMCLLRKK